MLDKIEEFHREASAAYLRGEFEASTRSWERILELDPDDERAEEGIRLCKQLIGGFDPAMGLRSQPSPAPDEADPLESELGMRDSTSPEAGAGDSAANELTRRIDALLVSARDQAQAGQRDAALRTLSRILILDEENEAASQMQAELRSGNAEMPAAPPQIAAPPVDLDLGVKLDLEQIDGDVDKPILTNAWVPPVAEQEEESAQPVADTAPSVSAPKRARAKRSLSLPSWAGDRRVQLGAGGLLLLALVVGGMQFIGGGDAAVPTEPLPVQSAEKRSKKKPAEATPDGMAQKTEGAQAAGTVVSLADPRKLMEQAEDAYAKGDYAAAVIAFGNVLKQVPEDAGVRARLDAAGKRYREQETIRLRWDEAVAAFASQNFGEALRLFYRMDQADYEADLTRAKVNGWYNHGVNALQMNRCAEAWDHFSEARSLDPLDEKILDGLEIARSCDSSAMPAALRSFSFRPLDG